MKIKNNPFLIASLAVITAFTFQASAARIYKDVTTTDLNAVENWATTSGGATDPTSISTSDALRFNEIFAPTSATNYTASLSADLSVGGIQLDSGSLNGGTATGNVIISSGNTLTLNGASLTDINYSNAGIVINSATGGTLTINPDIIVGANQQWVTSRALTVTGGINLNANTLSFNTAGTANVMTLSGVISGTGSLNKTAGTGTLTLNNTDNNFEGTVTLVGGTTNITKLTNGGSNSSLGKGSSSIVFNGATLSYTGTTTDTTDRVIDMRAGAAINNNGVGGQITITAANVSQGGTASARILSLGGSNTNDNTFNSILGNSGSGTSISTLQKNGTGKWIITGTQLYTGATIVNAGLLAIGGSTILGGATGSTADAGNIVFGQNLNSGRLEFVTVANLGAADQIRFRNTGGTAGLGGALVYVGTTDETLSKTIQCDTSIGIRLESNSVGGKLTYNGPFSQTNRMLYLGGTGTGDNTLATAFTGTGGLTKRDAGTWILTGTNTYTGDTTVMDGVLTVSGTSIANGNKLIINGGKVASTGIEIVNTLFFGTTQQVAGTWGATGSGATYIDDTRFSGLAGVVIVNTGPPTYASWTSTNGVVGQAADLDHDNDGVPNGVEYFIGGPTGNTTGFTSLPGVTTTMGSLSVTWTKAASYTGTYGTDFFVETSTTLEAGSWTTEVVSPNSGFTVVVSGNNVTFTFPAAGPAKKFARLKVTGP
jgi:fibronectin-binding autotransporter adhesin